MCPFCLATAALIAAAAVSTGGVTALAVRKAVSGQAANVSTTTPSKEDRNG